MAHKRLTKTRAKRIRRRLRRDELKHPVKVVGEINFNNDPTLEEISPYLRGCEKLILRDCVNLHTLPDNLKVDLLDIAGCLSLRKLPSGLHARNLVAWNSGLRGMAGSVKVHEILNLSNCREFVRLPNKLNLWYLYLQGCVSLIALPDNLWVSHLDMSGCINFTTWGAEGRIIDIPKHPRDHSAWRGVNAPRSVILNNCRRLTYLPEWMNTLHYLDIRNCINLTTLPASLQSVTHLEIGDSGVVQRPDGVTYRALYWNGVSVSEQIAWQPETLTVDDALRESNLEVRRVIIERIGYERFFAEADADLLDIDEDSGGERQLLRVNLPDTSRFHMDEAIVCLAVNCPSTQRQYVLRVPPNMRNCHQAAAWIAGFDNPQFYRPLIET
jgi:hypothetical protein